MVLFKSILGFSLILAAGVKADKSCAARKMPGQSVVCVCTADYCDEITRQAPAQGEYVAYLSSEAGSRFNKVIGDFTEDNSNSSSEITLNINPDIKYQTIEGFGGSVTDSAGINWLSLNDSTLKQHLIDSYFSNKGLEYNMLRVPIGGSDFSTHPYAYNEHPVNDITLSNFTLSPEDYNMKIPMIKAIKAVATDNVHIVATTWSPPPWMKTNNRITGASRLLPQYYQTYADYHMKFMEKYAEEDIQLWALTTTNEPTNGVINSASFNDLGWNPSAMGKWITNNFGPTIRNSTFKNVKILTGDDQRLTLPLWFNLMVDMNPKSLEYIDGIAVHYYTDKFVSPSVLTYVSKAHPDKFILSTEACEGAFPWQQQKVLLGSWDRAKTYIHDIIEDLNYNLVGWIDWNLCLDSQGGPNWVRNFVDSPVIVLPESKEFVKQPTFYAMGHFAKFIPRGSRRIETTIEQSFFSFPVETLAVLTPRNTVVVVVFNDVEIARKISLKVGNKKAVVSLEAKSIVTVEMPYEG